MLNLKKENNNMKINNSLNMESVIRKNLDIDDVDLDGEKVMMDLEKGQYYMMNDVAGKIWTMLKDEIRVKDIMNTLLNEYEVDEDACKVSVLKFLGKLENAKLININ